MPRASRERNHCLRPRPAAPRCDHRRASLARLRHEPYLRRRRRGCDCDHEPDTSIDVYLGTGGAPEGVLAASALRCVGGQCRASIFRNDDEIARARRWGIEDLDRIYSLEEMAKSDCIFAATGVTDGSLLEGRSPAQELHHHGKHRDARKLGHDPPRLSGAPQVGQLTA